MKKVLISSMIVFLISSFLNVPTYAVGLNTSSTAISMHFQGAGSTLNAKQKALVQDAMKILSGSIATAKSAYSLLVADAKANRDQLLLGSNKDTSAIASARAKYSTDLSVAKSFLNDAMKQANKIYAESLVTAGVSLSK